MYVGETAKRLTVYVDERDKHHHRPVYEAVLDVLREKRIAGASLFRGMAGYGPDGHFHSAKMLELSSDLPLMIEAVDSAGKIEAALPELCGIVVKGLVTVSDVTVVSCP
ncbi:MAG: DUF190 domain-containing protein [Pseudomonadota bacterium]